MWYHLYMMMTTTTTKGESMEQTKKQKQIKKAPYLVKGTKCWGADLVFLEREDPNLYKLNLANAGDCAFFAICKNDEKMMKQLNVKLGFDGVPQKNGKVVFPENFAEFEAKILK